VTVRRQGLGGEPLGGDSPLFGKRSPEEGMPTGSGSVPQKTPGDHPLPPWDPRADDFHRPPGTDQNIDPEEAEDVLNAMRDLLPADESERSLDDWGRSERVVSAAAPLLDFYFDKWFRVEVGGIENIPDDGGGLIVANHSGALPPDAAMIVWSIRNRHRNPRPVYVLGEHWFKGYPGVSMLVNKLGLVPAHRANAQRLLRDEGRLAIVFPEGQKATRKLLWQKYRLRRFGRGGFVRTAIKARVPIVPVAVVGAEEAMPIFAHLGFMKKLTGLIYFPITPAFPHFGLAGALMYLPAKFRIEFMEPIDMSEYPVETVRDPAAIQAISERIRGQIQTRLDEMVRARKSVWTG
jgi:1-acyl-sn-glycerol-3-phosphate acyltransferase